MPPSRRPSGPAVASTATDSPEPDSAATDLLKPADVARRLKVSRSWVYDAAADRRLPSIRLGGPDAPLRFVLADLEQWIEDARATERFA